MASSSSAAVELDDLEDQQPEPPPPPEPPKYRLPLLIAIGVTLLVFIAARGSAAVLHPASEPQPPLKFTKPAFAKATAPAPAIKIPPRAKKAAVKKASAKERQKVEEMRLNDIKTQEIRAAQEDPNSMFDMSNAR